MGCLPLPLPSGTGVDVRVGGREGRFRVVESGASSRRAFPAWMRRMRLFVYSGGKLRLMSLFNVLVLACGVVVREMDRGRSGREAEKRIVREKSVSSSWVEGMLRWDMESVCGNGDGESHVACWLVWQRYEHSFRGLTRASSKTSKVDADAWRLSNVGTELEKQGNPTLIVLP